MDALFWNDDWVRKFPASASLPHPPQRALTLTHPRSRRLAGWQVETPRAQMHAQIDAATNAPSWVTDGAYTSYADAFYPKATDIVWLDFPLHVTFLRVLKRTWRRWQTGERLFGTNCQEEWRKTLFSKESILW